jgi:hypothetical protein
MNVEDFVKFTSVKPDVKLAVPTGFNIHIWRILIRKWRHAQATYSTQNTCVGKAIGCSQLFS